MAQTLKCWVLMGREVGQTEWQLVDDPRTEEFRKCVEDVDVKKFSSVVFWDKDLAKGTLEELKEYAEEKKLDWEFRLGGLWGEVSEGKGRG